MTLVFTLGLALLFFVGFTACQKDGIEAETLLASADGQTTYEGDSDGKVTTRSSGTCECEYKFNSITDVSPTSGNHVEMQALTNQDNCSAGCPWALAFYGCGYYSFWNGNTCATDLGTGSISFTFPTRWIPFNCSIPEGDIFNKRFYLTQWNSACNTANPLAGKIGYSIRCRGGCSSEWEYNTDNLFTFSGSGNAYLDFTIALQEGADTCECSPVID